jgi:hypothetical protein
MENKNSGQRKKLAQLLTEKPAKITPSKVSCRSSFPVFQIEENDDFAFSRSTRMTPCIHSRSGLIDQDAGFYSFSLFATGYYSFSFRIV